MSVVGELGRVSNRRCRLSVASEPLAHRRQSGVHVDGRALLTQRVAQRREQVADVLSSGLMAHAADAPDVALQCAQPAGDLEVVLVQQTLDDHAVVDAVGHADGVQAREPEVIGGVHLQAYSLDAGFQRASDA